MLIDKKTLEYLAELSRIELDGRSEEKLLKDLQNILGHFEELKSIDTENVEPTRLPSPEGEAFGGQVAGGTIQKNVFREDGKQTQEAKKEKRDELIKSFPEEENGYLKVPPVFE